MKITCIYTFAEIKNSSRGRKSAEQILESKFSVGLSVDPNKTLGIGPILFSTSGCSAGLRTD